MHRSVWVLKIFMFVSLSLRCAWLKILRWNWHHNEAKMKEIECGWSYFLIADLEEDKTVVVPFCECQCGCSIEMRKQRKVVDFFAAIWSGFFGVVYSSWRFISHDCSYSLIMVWTIWGMVSLKKIFCLLMNLI